MIFLKITKQNWCECFSVVKTEPLALVPVVDTPTPVPDSTMKNDLIWSALDEVFEQQGMKIEEVINIKELIDILEIEVNTQSPTHFGSQA